MRAHLSNTFSRLGLGEKQRRTDAKLQSCLNSFCPGNYNKAKPTDESQMTNFTGAIFSTYIISLYLGLVIAIWIEI